MANGYVQHATLFPRKEKEMQEMITFSFSILPVMFRVHHTHLGSSIVRVYNCVCIYIYIYIYIYHDQLYKLGYIIL